MMEGLLQRIQSNRTYNTSLLLVFIGSILLINYKLEQSDFLYLMLAFSVANLIYFFALKSADWKLWLYASIGLRFLLIFAFPNLSDDIYRFIWDGHLLNLGFDPFEYVPRYYFDEQIEPTILQESLYFKLNSKDYFSVYPPFAQLIFFISTKIAGSNIFLASIIMKAFIFAAEIGSISLIIKLLKQWKLRPEKILLYSLNPLILIELSGNIHFEAFMIFFFLAALHYLTKGKYFQAACFMSFSIASKLITLIPQVFIIKRMDTKNLFYYGFSVLTVLFLCFIPLYSSEFATNFSSSLDLYFRNFEFNASIYFVVNGLVEMILGYGLISIVGPSLSILTVLLIIILAIRDKESNYKSFTRLSFWAMCIYLMLSTTVHPWYLALPIALAVFTNYRFIYLWSFLAFLSYSKYSVFEDYYYILVIVEYISVYSILLWECRNLLIARSLKVK